MIIQLNVISNLIKANNKLSHLSSQLIALNQSKGPAVINELNELIRLFNITTKFEKIKNAEHLHSILMMPLPSFEDVLGLLSVNPSTYQRVVTEFNESAYLYEVWKIDELQHLYINFLILIYRTTLLNHYEYLREKGAQISSTLEELAALNALENKKSLIFEATKRWLTDWKEEDFSELLFNDLHNNSLL
jgi:hypothetical protein